MFTPGKQTCHRCVQEYTIMPGHIQATSTFAGNHPRKIVGSVAQSGVASLRREVTTIFANFPGSTGWRVMGSRISIMKKIRPVMQSVMPVTINCRARSIHFCHAGNIITTFKTQFFFNGEPHFSLRVSAPQIILRNFNLSFNLPSPPLFRKQKSHRGCRSKTGRAQIAQKLQVHFKIAGSHRYSHHAKSSLPS